MPEPDDPLAIAAIVAAILDDLGVRYSVGGSLASTVAGEPRATIDVDMLVELGEHHVDAALERFAERFYVPENTFRRAVGERSSVNVIDYDTSIKVDLFVAGGTPLDRDTLARRIPLRVRGIATPLYYHTPEDILLQKLRWYRRGGEVSERQWRDVIGIVRVQSTRLDRQYLGDGAGKLGVADLLERALADRESS